MSRAHGHGPRGEVVEWFMALVLKTSVGASSPSVRIRPSPFQKPSHRLGFLVPRPSATGPIRAERTGFFAKDLA